MTGRRCRCAGCPSMRRRLPPPGGSRPATAGARLAQRADVGARVRVGGVPVGAAEAYLARLIRAGHRVAIAEQTESPAEAKKRGSKSRGARGTGRVGPAGGGTEEALLDSRAANWLVAVAK